jgi:hypothetical protein
MKLRLKLKDLVDLLINQNYKEFRTKYSLTRKNLISLNQALKSGKWRIAERCKK